MSKARNLIDFCEMETELKNKNYVCTKCGHKMKEYVPACPKCKGEGVMHLEQEGPEDPGGEYKIKKEAYLDNPPENVKIYHSKELKGLTGENGEEWVVFLRNWKNPLASGWVWVNTEEEAKKLAKEYAQKTGEEPYKPGFANLSGKERSRA